MTESRRMLFSILPAFTWRSHDDNDRADLKLERFFFPLLLLVCFVCRREGGKLLPLLIVPSKENRHNLGEGFPHASAARCKNWWRRG